LQIKAECFGTSGAAIGESASKAAPETAPTTFPTMPNLKPIRRFPPDTRRRDGLKRIAGGLLPACLLVVLAVSCFSDPGIAPVPPTGPVTEDFLRQRHQFMLDTVVERPKRMARYLREQDRLETARNLASFDQMLSEQQRVLAELRKIQARGGEEFGLLLNRQEQLSRSLRRQRGFASPRDQAAFSRVLSEQKRILAELNKVEALDLETFNQIQGRQRGFHEERAERRRLERELTLSVFLQALLEQERILLEIERRRQRDDELFFEIQGEAFRHRQRLERERLELRARFLERFGQPSNTQSTSGSLPLSGF